MRFDDFPTKHTILFSFSTISIFNILFTLYVLHTNFFLRALAMTMASWRFWCIFLKGEEEGSSRLIHAAYSRIPMTQTLPSIYIYTWASSDNRRIWLYTSVCNFFPPFMMACMLQYSMQYSRTHTLDTAVSLFRHHPRLFCPRYQKSVVFFLFKPFNLVYIYIYPYTCVFFSLFSFILIYSYFSFLFGPVVRIKRTCEDWSPKRFRQWMEYKENVVELACNNTTHG